MSRNAKERTTSFSKIAEAVATLPVGTPRLDGEVADKRATIFLSARLARNGLDAYRVAQRKGYEDVVAKDGSAAYIEGPSNERLNFKVHQQDEFVILGDTAPAGSRQHFGTV